jgi:hypothetical protein
MGAVSELVLRMINEVFNQRDAKRRTDVIEDIFAEDAVFSDPEGTVFGRNAVAAKIDTLLTSAPAFEFSLVEPIREVADLGIDRWQFGPDGAAVVRGTDVSLVRHGRIERLYTIVDQN